jgi:hypothetical protein
MSYNDTEQFLLREMEADDLIESDGDGWRMTAKGREFRDLLEKLDEENAREGARLDMALAEELRA